MIHVVEIECYEYVPNNFFSATVDIEVTIEDCSFDHEFGTQELMGIDWEIESITDVEKVHIEGKFNLILPGLIKKQSNREIVEDYLSKFDFLPELSDIEEYRAEE